jgi:septal ring factor EnvC (AmiA/AmiB activator)
MNAIGILLLALLPIAGLCAQTESDAVDTKRKDLENMQRALEDLEQDLEARRNSRSVLAGELERHERDVAQLARAGHQLNAMIDEQVRALEKLQRELEVERGHLESERRSLSALLRSAYALGSDQYIRMLLDQEDMARMGRTLSYYGYLNRYRIRRLQDFSERARRLEALRLEASEETQRLAMLAARQEATRDKLETAQAQRTALLADLEATISGREERLTELRQDAEALRALVEQLERRALVLPEADVAKVSIAKRRGTLAWPLGRGRILRRFGQTKGDGGQRWDGVLLAAPEGSEVHAIHHGRVAYADWLRGFGLLIIIEHDEGYMSLYGHNQTLFKEPGEWVDDGEAIALSGSSGGQRNSGLYFAIRHQGRPLNPERWCHSVRKLGRRQAPNQGSSLSAISQQPRLRAISVANAPPRLPQAIGAWHALAAQVRETRARRERL